jgi:TolB-like protein
VNFPAISRLVLVALLLAVPLRAAAQQPEASASASAQTAPGGHLILVLPFENRSPQPNNVDWIGEAMPEVMNRRLDSAGFLPIGREDRLYALDHLGLPPNFRPSRASTIRLAQNLDADSVVIGSYESDGKRITITARILDVASLKLDPPVERQVDLPRLLDGINGLAWQLVRQIEPAYPVAEQTFVAADSKLPLSVFENYTRGLVEDTPAERVKHLKEAARLDPTYFARLARSRQVCISASSNTSLPRRRFAKVPATDPGALGAAFDRGLASFYTGNYSQAEESFAFVATQLPLSEVINNQGGRRQPTQPRRDRALPASRRRRPQRPRLPLQPGARPSPPGRYARRTAGGRRMPQAPPAGLRSPGAALYLAKRKQRRPQKTARVGHCGRAVRRERDRPSGTDQAQLQRGGFPAGGLRDRADAVDEA